GILWSAMCYGFSFCDVFISMVCCGLVAFLIGLNMASNKQRVIIYTVLGGVVLLLGLSRYILNVHFFADIISGFLFGSIILFGFIHLYKLLMKIRRRRKNSYTV